MQKKKKQNAKDIVLPHSQAKLNLYQNYLILYLRVLSLSEYIDKINLYDAFCGIGIYKDGKEGSPLITNKCISETHAILNAMNRIPKPITITVNDFDKKKILNVENILKANMQPSCTYTFYSEDANMLLERISKELKTFTQRERNLIFIDPYGYSPIKKEKIYNLLDNDRTEIILFLPVSQMYRFKEIAFENENRTCYENLRIFLNSFLDYDVSNIDDSQLDVFEFINAIKDALSFKGKYYTCSHYIHRGGANYHALFFITANIYGLDKMIETKWKLDPNNGAGFAQSSVQKTLFETEFQQVDKSLNIEILVRIIQNYLKINNTIDNCSAYELGLINEFKPSHTAEAIDKLFQRKIITYVHGESNTSKNLDYTHFRKNDITFTIKLAK